MKIFLDANVVFSASNIASNIARFVDKLQERHTLVTSPYAMAEAEKNITAKRPQWMEGFTAIQKKIIQVKDIEFKTSILLAEKDKPLLGAAIASQCHYFLTGDKRDFGHLFGKEVLGVTVVSYLLLAEKLYT